MLSYLSHPPYVLLPSLPPLPKNHLPFSPNQSSSTLLSPRARHGHPALQTSAPLPHLHRAIKPQQVDSNCMGIRITTSEMMATYPSCETRPLIPESLSGCTYLISATHTLMERRRPYSPWSHPEMRPTQGGTIPRGA